MFYVAATDRATGYDVLLRRTDIVGRGYRFLQPGERQVIDANKMTITEAQAALAQVIDDMTISGGVWWENPRIVSTRAPGNLFERQSGTVLVTATAADDAGTPRSVILNSWGTNGLSVTVSAAEEFTKRFGFKPDVNKISTNVR